MDWTQFWAAVGGVVSAVAVLGGIVWWGLDGRLSAMNKSIDALMVNLVRYTDASVKACVSHHQANCPVAGQIREQIESVIDAKLAHLATEVTTRINGTYMRTPEANVRFADLQRQIDNLK